MGLQTPPPPHHHCIGLLGWLLVQRMSKHDLKTRLETDKRKLSHSLVPPMGEAELSEAVVPPQHWLHPLLPHWRDSVMKTTLCSPALRKTQPLLQFQTQGLGWCVRGKWPQRQGPASNESTASASKSPSKYRFIGLLIKITDSLSDGCPGTQGAETAVKRPRKPLATSLPRFLNLVLHSLPPFPLASSPTAASQSPSQVNPPSINRNSLP